MCRIIREVFSVLKLGDGQGGWAAAERLCGARYADVSRGLQTIFKETKEPMSMAQLEEVRSAPG